MIVKEGPASHSPFKLESLLRRLQSIDQNIDDLGTGFIHLIDSKNDPDEEQDRILDSILSMVTGLLELMKTVLPYLVLEPLPHGLARQQISQKYVDLHLLKK